MGRAAEHRRPADELRGASGRPAEAGARAPAETRRWRRLVAAGARGLCRREARRAVPPRGGAGGGAGAGGGDGGGRALRESAQGSGGSRAPTAARRAPLRPRVPPARRAGARCSPPADRPYSRTLLSSTLRKKKIKKLRSWPFSPASPIELKHRLGAGYVLPIEQPCALCN